MLTEKKEFFDSIMFSTDEESIQLKSEYECCQKKLNDVEDFVRGAESFCNLLNHYCIDSFDILSEKWISEILVRIEVHEGERIGNSRKHIRLDFYFTGIENILS